VANKRLIHKPPEPSKLSVRERFNALGARVFAVPKKEIENAKSDGAQVVITTGMRRSHPIHDAARVLTRQNLCSNRFRQSECHSTWLMPHGIGETAYVSAA